MPVNNTAATGYEAASDAYERGRPEYPSDAVDYIARKLPISGGRTILDLGAGTGKFSRLIVPFGASIVAIEPVDAMRKKLIEAAPSARVSGGTAERIPLPHASVDGAVVAQAFHWFDGPAALAEIHRVLVPGGRLALIWNVRDESVRWVEELTKIIDPYQGESTPTTAGANNSG
jgi:ubiquinone/menaquinone biosynthesis C-methylase UbiE